jgi:hypothetical protein
MLMMKKTKTFSNPLMMEIHIIKHSATPDRITLPLDNYDNLTTLCFIFPFNFQLLT